MITPRKLESILRLFQELPNGEMSLPFYARFLTPDGFSPPFKTSIDVQEMSNELSNLFAGIEMEIIE